MKNKFILKYRQTILNDGLLNISIFPDHYYLNDKIEVCQVLENSSDLQAIIDDLFTIHKPLMFAKIQEMENIPQNIKDEIEL